MGKTRRYNAKKIAKTPSLKRNLALFIAERTKIDKSVVDLIAYGHRGLISHDEKDLCKMFDKLYAEKLAEIEEHREALKAKIHEYGDKGWRVETTREKIKELEKSLLPYEEIAGEIFEENVLK